MSVKKCPELWVCLPKPMGSPFGTNTDNVGHSQHLVALQIVDYWPRGK